MCHTHMQSSKVQWCYMPEAACGDSAPAMRKECKGVSQGERKGESVSLQMVSIWKCVCECVCTYVLFIENSIKHWL